MCLKEEGGRERKERRMHGLLYPTACGVKRHVCVNSMGYFWPEYCVKGEKRVVSGRDMLVNGCVNED